MCAAGLWDPVKIPDGLTCKNTFFDVPAEDDSSMNVGPATCPLPTEGWWSSPSVSQTCSNTSPGCLDDIGPTPDWFNVETSVGGAVGGPHAGRHFERLLAEADEEDEDDDWTATQPGTIVADLYREPVPLYREPVRLPVAAFELPVQHVLPVPVPHAVAPATGGRILVELARELGLQPDQTEKPAVKTRRRRGSKESKEPDRCHDLSGWLPTATYVDLGGLVKIEPSSKACNEQSEKYERLD